ncbi:hypothetical protein [Variovorax sp. RA8]|uniref:hypothetical protein n=1 Tax=Variovorax sp. (strain JCM 16519 / RA8) TaxID=662548 RepID=UPI0013172E77|nr:hypothetical protein [Variovorax sp. RA8]VTU44169.1 hypothetical protein RA8P2_00063 [Variovorax sp. RA8]
MMQAFHCKVCRAGQLNPGVIDMHARIAFRVDQQALAEIFGEEAKWRELCRSEPPPPGPAEDLSGGKVLFVDDEVRQDRRLHAPE